MYMSKMGIGWRFHEMSLKQHPFVMEFIDHQFDPVAAGQKGLMLVGSNERSREAFVLMARWVIMCGGAASVMSLPRLANAMIQGPTDVEDEMFNAEYMCVTAFQHEGDCPLDARSKAQVEELITWRLDNERPTLLLSSQPSFDWWNRRFQSFLDERFLKLEYHG